MTRFTLIGTIIGIVIFFGTWHAKLSAEPSVAPPEYAQRGWSTVALGGVLPSAQQWMTMRDGDYVLCASAGTWTQIPAQKTPLPIDPCGNVQYLALFVDSTKTIYAAQCSVLF